MRVGRNALDAYDVGQRIRQSRFGVHPRRTGTAPPDDGAFVRSFYMDIRGLLHDLISFEEDVWIADGRRMRVRALERRTKSCRAIGSSGTCSSLVTKYRFSFGPLPSGCHSESITVRAGKCSAGP
ncbi:hypothetical protein SHIRM173S_09424 [Streptomyces hirsutus]